MTNVISRKTNAVIEGVIRATNTPGEVLLLFIVVMLASAGLFALVEGHAYFDGLYWSVTTATSTGYGDITPKTFMGKGLAIFVMVFTILFILPLMIYRTIELFTRNKHEWTDAEQRRHFANQESGLINQKQILHNQRLMMAQMGIMLNGQFDFHGPAPQEET